jgi:glycine cleavage system H protein
VVRRMVVIYPDELKYTASHTWLRLEKEAVNRGRVGITDYCIAFNCKEKLKEVFYVELPEVGSKINYMEPFSIMESIRSVWDIYSPVSGKVVGVNHYLIDEPGLVNQDPYGKGWLIEVELSNPSEIQQLLSAQVYQATLSGKV